MKIYCNPLNFGYKYQFNKQNDGSVVASREAADPSLIRFQGKYLLFPSMTAGFLYSEDLAHWEFQPTEHLPIYDYAPDVRAAGEYLYFCASSHEEGVFYRTRDPFGDEYERIEGAFPFWDPDLFVDEDGKFYFYWGSSTTEPLYGIELDPATMQPVGEKVALCAIDTGRKGYERNGENQCSLPLKGGDGADSGGTESEEYAGVNEGGCQKLYHGAALHGGRLGQQAQWSLLSAIRHAVFGPQYLRRWRLCQRPASRALCAGKEQPLLLQAGRIFAGSGTRFHHGGCRRFCLAYLDHAYLQEPQF